MMIHRVAFCCSWNESFACRLLDSFSSRNDVVMKRKNRNNCEIISFNDFIVVEKLNFFFILFTFYVSKQFNLLTARNSFRYFERQYSRYSRDWELFIKNERAHFFLFIKRRFRWLFFLSWKFSLISIAFITKFLNESLNFFINANTLLFLSITKESRFIRRKIMIVSTSVDDANERNANERDVSERDVNERDVSERDVNEQDVNEWDNIEELDEEDDELSEEEKINRLNDDKKLKKEKASKEENAIERVAERLKRRDAEKKRNARREEVRFMKRKDVNVLENELEDELKREKSRMKAFIFKRLIMKTKCKYNANVCQITINEILYFWCKTKAASIDDNEFSVWDFSNFSTHSLRFLHLNLRLMKVDA
jgi:flagellar biosynthesis GTPase FlhF